MEARTEPVVGVTAISLHPAPTVSPAVACSSSKRFAEVAEAELTSNDDALPPHSKKRRKQSRPIRIPTPTSPVPLAVQDEGDAEEAEEGELKCSAYLLQPRQNDEHDQGEKIYPPSSDANSSYTSSMHSLLPSLLSFPPHFLLPMLPAGPTPNPTAAPPPRIFNLEAYCELCSKEFCNKYFLKTHKANRHGIYVQSGDTPPMSTTPLPPVSAPSPTVQTPPAVKSGASKPAATTTVSDQKASCDTCHKKFNHEHSVKRHKAKVHWGGSAEGVSESNVDEASRPPCSPSSVHEPESANVEPAVEEHIPPATSPLSPGRLRRLGVINADAFCEICSKEYCNKYFLKTHKLKRHGIIVRDSDDMKAGDFKPTSCKPKMWEQGATSFIQTSPLNLTVHEQATCSNSSDSGVLRTEEVEKQEAPSPRPDSRDISEDLQKLQTMLLQLNALNGTSVSCESFMAPQQDETNVDPPEANLENGAVGDSSHESPASPAIPPAGVVLEANEDFVQHMTEELGETTPRQLEADDAETQSGGSVPFSTSCYCDICNKELCNKYFKKVHMQKMHGIEIKDNALSGGVPCDICHKQLCSKYFVRVHKQNTHGIVDLSAPTPPNSGRGSAGSPLDAPVQLPLHTTPPEAAKSSETADLSHRYYTHFNVVCPLCSRRFRSAKWLKAHLLNDHAEIGLEIARELDSKPKLSNNNSSKTTEESNDIPVAVSKESSTSAAMLSSLLRCGVDERTTSYHCSYCNFSTPVLSLLFVHERTHTGLGASPLQAPAPRNALTCHLCFKNFGQSDLLQRHLRSHQMAGLQ
ncbi:hypothetical protein B566_EDAN009821 [Ephemera danica]|nr:hypothetical protein B566_EDAN009821 [Ephemera danica]